MGICAAPALCGSVWSDVCATETSFLGKPIKLKQTTSNNPTKLHHGNTIRNQQYFGKMHHGNTAFVLYFGPGRYCKAQWIGLALTSLEGAFACAELGRCWKRPRWRCGV